VVWVEACCAEKGSIMQNTHDKDNSHQQRPSPWEAFHEQQRASAQKYHNLRNEVGRLFRDAQHEAQGQWLVWDSALNAEDDAAEAEE